MNKYAIKKLNDLSQQQLQKEKQANDRAKLARTSRQRLIVNTIKHIIEVENKFVNQDIRM